MACSRRPVWVSISWGKSEKAEMCGHSPQVLHYVGLKLWTTWRTPVRGQEADNGGSKQVQCGWRIISILIKKTHSIHKITYNNKYWCRVKYKQYIKIHTFRFFFSFTDSDCYILLWSGIPTEMKWMKQQVESLSHCVYKSKVPYMSEKCRCSFSLIARFSKLWWDFTNDFL